MAEIQEKRISNRYRGRITQVPIYIGKFFRMFIYQNDWKVIPMAAFIAILVSFVVKSTFAVTMEGTSKGALALMSVSLWNGFFNSIQVVCRERNIIKREHRSGLHISSYIFAHMVYQFFLCALQTITTLLVFISMGFHFPATGVVFKSFLADMFITLFLITYAADMLSLLVSCLVKSTTAAMTVMPLILMVQLVFSGSMFVLPDTMKPLSAIMISNHGNSCINAEARFNELPSSMGWTLLKKMADRPDSDPKMKAIVAEMEATGQDNVVKMEMAKSNYNANYDSTYENVKHHWHLMIIFSFVYAGLAVVALEFIDKDKR